MESFYKEASSYNKEDEKKNENALFYEKINIDLDYNFFKLIFGPCNETEWSITLQFEKKVHETVLNNINPNSYILEERLYIKNHNIFKTNNNQLIICKNDESNKDIVLRIDDYGKRVTGKIKTRLNDQCLYNCKKNYNYEIDINQKITDNLYSKALTINNKRYKIWYFYVATSMYLNDSVYFKIAVRQNLDDDSKIEINVECELENILSADKNFDAYEKEIPKYVYFITNYYYNLFINENHIWKDDYDIIFLSEQPIICKHVSANCVFSEKNNKQCFNDTVLNIITSAVLQNIINEEKTG